MAPISIILLLVMKYDATYRASPFTTSTCVRDHVVAISVRLECRARAHDAWLASSRDARAAETIGKIAQVARCSNVARGVFSGAALTCEADVPGHTSSSRGMPCKSFKEAITAS